MVRRGALFWIYIAVSIAVALTVIFSVLWQAIYQPPARDKTASTAANLGIVYLPVSPEVARYYGLEEASGALVTEVAKGSPLTQAGIKPGDIILAFNDTSLGEDAPLLGLLRSCQDGDDILLRFWSCDNSCISTVTVAW